MSKETGTNYVYNMYHADSGYLTLDRDDGQEYHTAKNTPQASETTYKTAQDSESTYYAPPKYITPEAINEDDPIGMYKVERGEIAKHNKMKREKKG